MKRWLKFFGLSFFSDKIAKEGAKRGYINFVLGFLLALIILFCGVLASDILPFSTHYNYSSDFQALVHNALANPSADKRVTVKIQNRTASAGIGSEQTGAGAVIDTYANGDDRAEYSLNGYNLVVDTRPAEAFDDFEAYYLSNDGKNEEISFEDYSTLSDVAKRNFDFKIRYTAKELVLTDGLTAKHEEFLSGKDNADYKKLLENKPKLSKEEYQSKVYTLYVKTFYPDITAYERTGSVPLLRNYYFHNYVNNGGKNYLFIFDDSLVGSFETDGGYKLSFYGFYNGMKDGFAVDGDNLEKLADTFIKSAFKATSSLSVYVYVMNTLRLIPFIALMPLLLSLIAFCVLRILKIETRFGGCVKIVGSYQLFASLISALITFVCGYFVPRESLSIASIICFFIVLAVRTAVLLITESINVKKIKAVQEAEQADEEPFTENQQ